METYARRALPGSRHRGGRGRRCPGGWSQGAQGPDPVWSFSCLWWRGRPLLGRETGDMVPGRLHWMNARGFSMTELLVVLAVTGILAVLGYPYVATYLQTASLKAGAQ